MNSLELVRKLYEGETDLTALENELDESAREELRHLVEAKEALEAMPRSRPPQKVIDSIVAKASHQESRQSPLTLILTNRPLQRMAAAAIVVVAIGVGYLTLRTDGIMPLDTATEMTHSAETPAPADERQALGKEEMESLAVAPAESARRGDLAETKSAAPSAPQASVDDNMAFQERDVDMEIGGAVAEAEPRGQVAAADRLAMMGNEVNFADSSLMEGAETHDLLSWDQEEEALRTFFWQVRALDGRSPSDDWEEAVPLEGSFERLEKQQPGNNRWLQTGSQR